MKNRILAISLLLVCVSQSAFARQVECPPAHYENLFAREGKVFIQLRGLPWHFLGSDGDVDLDEKMQNIEIAQREGKYIQLVFPASYSDTSCMMSDREISVSTINVLQFMEEMEN